MTVVKDRRNEPTDDKYGTDKLRFRNLYIEQIRKAMHDKIAKDSLKNLGKEGFKVPIPAGSTREPVFHHRQGDGKFQAVFPGNVRLYTGMPDVLPGNVSFDVGDRVKKPNGGRGRGNQAGEGDGEDDFLWVNQEELKDILFEGRALPDMTKLKGDHIKEMERVHSGFTNKGPEHRLDMSLTDRKRKEAELVLTKVAERQILNTLCEQYNILVPPAQGASPLELASLSRDEKREAATKAARFALGDRADTVQIPVEAVYALSMAVEALKKQSGGLLGTQDVARMGVLESRLAEQFRTRSKVGNFRDEHLTYEYDEDQPKPGAKAVMFFKMDVSGSMGQEEKNNAKVFFWLLSEFLNEAYDQVEFVFIAHTTTAEEVDEQAFFYGQKTGGTTVSTCHQKMLDIIKERYSPSEWNIYSAQATDGDNYDSDNLVVDKLMMELAPMIQAHYYIEVPNSYRRETGLTDLGLVYENLAQKTGGKVHTASDVRTPVDALEAFKYFFPVGKRVPTATFSPAMAPA